MKCLLLSLQQLLRLIVFFFFVSTRAGQGGGGEVNFADFHAVDSDEEAAGLFSARCAPSPAPSQQNVKYLLDFFLLLFFYYYYSLGFMSMLFQSCVSGSHRLCLTGRLDVLAFLKKKKQEIKNNMDTVAIGCFEKRKKKTLFLWNRGENNNNNNN